jgi:hypothetical protein
MTALFRMLALLVAVLLLAGPPAGAQEPKAKGETEELLTKAKFDFKKIKDGVYRVVVEGRGELSAVILEERQAGWKDSGGKPMRYVYIWSQVLSFPADFKPPVGMLMRIAELNDKWPMGSIGISKDAEGMTVNRNFSAYLPELTAEQLTTFLYLCHNDRLFLRKDLGAFRD